MTIVTALSNIRDLLQSNLNAYVRLIFLVFIAGWFSSCSSSTGSSDTFVITASAGPHGTIKPSGAIKVKTGSTQTFSITADTGNHIVDVTVDGSSVGAVNSFTFPPVKSDHTIHASFAPSPYVIVATAGPHGSISPSGQVGGLLGGTQTFTITPDTGYHILDVIIDSVSQGPFASYTFSNIQSNHTISALFQINQYTIIASAGPHGTISPVGIISLTFGATQAFSISADLGYQVADVLVDSISYGLVTNYVFSNIDASHTINASFKFGQPESLIADGWKSYSNHDYVTAESLFDRATTINQTLVDGYNGAGWSSAYQNDLQTSDNRFQIAINLDSTFVEPKAGLAFVYNAQQKDSESIVLANSVLQAAPNWVFRRDTSIKAADLHLLLAEDYFAIGEYQLSLNQVQILDPSFSADVTTIQGLMLLANEIELLRSQMKISQTFLQFNAPSIKSIPGNLKN